jgi:peroxiredoxin
MKAWWMGLFVGLWAATAWSQTDTVAMAVAVATTNAVVAPPAKDFILESVNGQPIRLDQFDGRPVLLLFWATTDAPSGKQVAAVLPLLQQFGTNGLAVVGITIDEGGPVTVRQFVREQAIPFPVAMLTIDLLQDYGGLTAIPTLILLDRNHNIIRRYVGVTETEVLAADLRAILKSEPAR